MLFGLLHAFRLLVVQRMFDQPIRASITIGGVALGVATSVAIPTANVAILQSFEESVAAVAGAATLQVTGGELGLDEAVLPRLRAHPAVRAAQPVLQEAGRLAEGPRRGQPLTILALDLLEAADHKGLVFHEAGRAGSTVDDLEAMLEPDTIFVGVRLAADWKLEQGSVLPLTVGRDVHHFVVRGIVGSRDGLPSAWDSLGVMDIAAAQTTFGLIGRLDRIDIVTEPGRDLKAVERELQALLPAPLTVSRPSRRNEEVEQMVRSFQLNLGALSAVGLLVGLLLIYNTVAFAVAQRRREIGILRAIGMPGPLVVLLFVAQAAILGGLGGLLGSGLGALLTPRLVSLVGRTVGELYAPLAPDAGQLHAVPGRLLVHGLMLGLLVSLAGAAVPSLEAGRTAPARALAPGDYEASRSRHAGRLALLGALLLGAAWLLALPGPVNGMPLFGYAAAFCLLLGLSCWSPALIAFVGRSAAGGGGRSDGWPARIRAISRLAAAQLALTPGRSAVTVSALMVGIAMMVGVGTMVRSFRETVEIWINQTVMADLIVAPAAWLDGEEPGMLAKRLPLDWLQVVASTPGVAAVDPYRQLRLRIQDRPASLVARDLALHAARSRYLFLSGDSAETIRRALALDGVLVSEVLARRLGLQAGDELPLLTPAGLRRFPVAGIFYDYATDGGKVVMDRSLYRRWWGDDTATVFGVYLTSPQTAAAVRDALLTRLADDGKGEVTVIRNADLKAEILAIFDRTFKLTYVLELIAVAIALLGIVNTLLTSVLERQREMATLRALGASRRQIGHLIVWESCYLGLLGAALGLAGGALLSLLLVKVINRQSFGWTIQWTLSPPLLAEAVGLALAVALVAGYLPARWAARQPVAEGLRYE